MFYLLPSCIFSHLFLDNQLQKCQIKQCGSSEMIWYKGKLGFTDAKMLIKRKFENVQYTCTVGCNRLYTIWTKPDRHHLERHCPSHHFNSNGICADKLSEWQQTRCKYMLKMLSNPMWNTYRFNHGSLCKGVSTSDKYHREADSPYTHIHSLLYAYFDRWISWRIKQEI